MPDSVARLADTCCVHLEAELQQLMQLTGRTHYVRHMQHLRLSSQLISLRPKTATWP